MAKSKGVVIATATAALALVVLTGCASQGGAGLSCRQPQMGCKGMNSCKGRAMGTVKDMHKNSCGGKK